ncbi:AAA family ATPase [Pseudanabaenaceae cyanobacterium LEGE 13415]|nr:AAA family ATPase [Pseudanabaenaceae cyanobacterium LEGE 13415]
MSESFDPQFELSGYCAIEPIYFGSRTLVYRATRNSDRASVILKRLREQSPTAEEQAQFRNQYAMTKDLDLPGIVRTIGLESCGNSEILVMEDFGGMSLSEYLCRHKISIAEFLSIAVQLSKTLDELHQVRIVHKDIKPVNILIRPESMQVRLIDFSIASQLTHQTQALEHSNQLEGTLAYLSPEQTGRMNRSIDYRSDFYSLGVTFYELLTNQVPFTGEDALEIVYGHLAKEPPAIRSINPEVPEAIAHLVQKLMAKNAEDRYQSAKGLQADLEHCLEQWKTTGAIAEFEIGQIDRIAQFSIPEKLYGRESQVKVLLDAFERAKQGSGELVVVSGYSGIGKTSLIRELFKPMTESNAHFVAGKFDQFKRDIPYACLSDAYQGLIQQILAGTAEKIEYWRDRFQTVLGASAQCVIEVVPALELLIGKQPPMRELPPAEAQDRYDQAMFAFMMATSSPEHPEVEFMDDCQWADLSSITSLRTVMQSPENRYRLIVIAYRDNAVDSAHPLAHTLSQMQSEGIAFEQIHLAPLTLHDVIQFVADILHCHYSKVQPLAKLLYDKTQGNPFFLTQVLKSVYAEGLLTFHLGKKSWQWNLKQIQQQNISETIEKDNLQIFGWHCINDSQNVLFSSETLIPVAIKLAGYGASLEQYNQPLQMLCVRSIHQTVLNLLKPSENPCLLVGEVFDETATIATITGDKQILASFVYTLKVFLGCLFDRASTAREWAAIAKSIMPSQTGNTTWWWFYFYDSLAQLMAFDSLSDVEQVQALEQVTINEPILEQLAARASMNYQAKLNLVKAEQCRVMKQYDKAGELYDRAITTAIESGFIQEAALANELAAKFYFKLNKSKMAQAYLIKAYQQYERWGAIAKLRQLEMQYPDNLLFSISIHQTRSSTSTSKERLDLATILKATEAISSELVLEQLLDRLLHIVLENAGAQKGCIILDRDGELFIEVADTNQDASEVIVEAIPLAQSENFPLSVLNYVARTQQAIVLIDATTEIICATDPYVLKHRPKSLLCTPILYQGKFIGLVYLENNLVKGAFTYDRLETMKILMGQAAIAIENARLFACAQEKAAQLERSEARLSQLFEQSADAMLIFDPEQIIFTDCNPAAADLLGYPSKEDMIGMSPITISPEFQPSGRTSAQVAAEAIALAYQKGSHRFEWVHLHRNSDPIWLEIVLTLMTFDSKTVFQCIWRDISDRKRAEAALANSQAQLFQSEKMSALGNLVAGVAHEINNPIGFLNGSISNAKDFVQDLLDHLELYQQQLSNSETMQNHAEEIDLEFVKADLPKLLDSMKTAVDRIKLISNSLRIFSRADTENAIEANIHEGIDSTILILKYRLKANEYRPEIEIVTNYGTIPNIECFPGQLNQVFMNILANAIDMFDELAQQTDYLEVRSQVITIQTAQLEQTVEIRIRDNGKGMSEPVKAKVFDHLFTTKAVGKGTGLGLSIARQIIVEKHRGSIVVNSTISEGTEFVITLPIKQNL